MLRQRRGGHGHGQLRVEQKHPVSSIHHQPPSNLRARNDGIEKLRENIIVVTIHNANVRRSYPLYP